MSQIVSVSPHCHGKITTQSIMRDVLIALAPALVAGIINFGWRALLVTAVCAAACTMSSNRSTIRTSISTASMGLRRSISKKSKNHIVKRRPTDADDRSKA